jgi:transposase
MQAAKTIGLDIAKSVFQVHGVDADGEVVIRRKLKRRHVLAFFEKLPPCLIGMEDCATRIQHAGCAIDKIRIRAQSENRQDARADRSVWCALDR